MPNEREKIVLNAGDLNEFQFQCTECKSVFRIKVVGGKIIVSCGCGSTQGVEVELAELTAPAEGDVEAAEKAYRRAMIKASIKRKRGSLFLSSEIHKALVSEIAAALTTARKAERDSLLTGEQLHDGIVLGQLQEREKWIAAAEEVITAFEKMDNDFDDGIEITEKTYRRYAKARDVLQGLIEEVK